MADAQKINTARRGGILLICANDLALYWCGEGPVPELGFWQRLRLACGYIRSNGYGGIRHASILSLIKAVIRTWKSPQVSASGKAYDTASMPFAEAWASFNTTLCGLPHTLQGTDDAIDASSSSRS